MKTLTRRPHATTVIPPDGFRIQSWEVEHYHVAGNGAVTVYVDQVDGFVVQCNRHRRSAWWTPTAEHAAELVQAPYAWCDDCRADNDAMAAALLRRPVKVWSATAKVRAGDSIDTYRVTGKLGQSRGDVIEAARRTLRLHGVTPIPGTVVAELVEA